MCSHIWIDVCVLLTLKNSHISLKRIMLHTREPILCMSRQWRVWTYKCSMYASCIIDVTLPPSSAELWYPSACIVSTFGQHHILAEYHHFKADLTPTTTSPSVHVILSLFLQQTYKYTIFNQQSAYVHHGIVHQGLLVPNPPGAGAGPAMQRL